MAAPTDRSVWLMPDGKYAMGRERPAGSVYPVPSGEALSEPSDEPSLHAAARIRALFTPIPIRR